ncbi:MAG: YkgJ family cysteine cluster protein [Deltaproteobacteria bacterium]|nr:YkgJ family cysteine cluster protein [Deltaproteobacteria bacterium]
MNIFYENGLQFECTNCGECCRVHGEHAFVYLTPKNTDEMADSLGMTRDDFYKIHCTHDEDGRVILTMVDNHCNFLKNNQCTVYGVRPAQCRAWPFLSEHLNEETWKLVQTFCPGIGVGKRYSKEEIESIAQKRNDADGRA